MSLAVQAPIEALGHTLGEALAPSAGPTKRIAVAAPIPKVVQHFEYPSAAFSVQLWVDGMSPPCGAHLVEEAYSRLGYRSGRDTAVAALPDSATLHAVARNQAIGTLTVNFAGIPGLQAEALYPEEISALRQQGPVCEFTRLAIDRRTAGREVLCGLFYLAYAYAYFVKHIQHLVIEVNPRHEAFYARMLGFRRAGPERICPRVSAPAVLMSLDFKHTQGQIELARADQRFASAALYQFALPAVKERSLLTRLGVRLIPQM